MKNKLNNVFNNLLDSFNNKQGEGWSGRKLTAFFAVIMGAYITKYELPSEAQLHALYAWLVVVLLCLSIVTVEQVIRLKNGTVEKTTDKYDYITIPLSPFGSASTKTLSYETITSSDW